MFIDLQADVNLLMANIIFAFDCRQNSFLLHNQIVETPYVFNLRDSRVIVKLQQRNFPVSQLYIAECPWDNYLLLDCSCFYASFVVINLLL